MATARELLEQADALMRKNRKQVAADIPLLVDAVAPAAVADAVPDTASVEAPLASPASAPNGIDIPVLTDIVEARAAVVSVKETPPIVAPGFEGDPSNWLVMDTIDPSLNSITGGSPDTLLAESMFSSKAAGSAPTPPPARSASPPARPSPAPVAASPADDEHLPFVWEDPPGDEAAGPASETDVDASTSGESAAPVHEAPSRSIEVQNVTTVSEPVPHDGGVDVRAADAASAGEDDGALAMAAVEAAALPASVSLDSSAAVAAPAPAIANDDARWQALAEQISMQVLQRVDLFTDEGLREQLAGRLQPIMARASAELVDTITGHVGQLLRTYVAEAIEREIAAWRRDQP
jgi:hypothetical protein